MSRLLSGSGRAGHLERAGQAAFHVHLDHVPLVLGASTDVGDRVRGLGGQAPGVGEHAVARRGADERRLGGRRLDVRQPHRGEGDAGLADRAVVELQVDRRGDGREVADLAFQLEVRAARPGGRRGHADLGEHLVRRDRGLERVHQELADRDLALAGRALQDDARTEREHHRAEVAGRVRVGERSADRPEVADQGIRDLRRGGGDRRVARADDVVGGELVVPDQRADPQAPVFLLDAVQAFDPVDVDQLTRRGEPELHDRDQALPSREHLRVVAVRGEEAERLVEGRRSVVLEARRQHRLDLPSKDAKSAVRTMVRLSHDRPEPATRHRIVRTRRSSAPTASLGEPRRRASGDRGSAPAAP